MYIVHVNCILVSGNFRETGFSFHSHSFQRPNMYSWSKNYLDISIVSKRFILYDLVRFIVLEVLINKSHLFDIYNNLDD